MFYSKVADNEWNAFTFVDGVNVTVGGNAFADVQFTTAGALDTGVGDVDANGFIAIDTFNPGGGAADITGLTFDYSSTTQYGSDFTVNELSQDGYTSGRLSGVDVDDSLEPEVSIIKRDDAVVQEYRMNGVLYMVKVITVVGPPYYLFDSNGDGSLNIRRNELDPGLVVPSWMIFRW